MSAVMDAIYDRPEYGSYQSLVSALRGNPRPEYVELSGYEADRLLQYLRDVSRQDASNTGAERSESYVNDLLMPGESITIFHGPATHQRRVYRVVYEGSLFESEVQPPVAYKQTEYGLRAMTGSESDEALGHIAGLVATRFIGRYEG